MARKTVKPNPSLVVESVPYGANPSATPWRVGDLFVYTSTGQWTDEAKVKHLDHVVVVGRVTKLTHHPLADNVSWELVRVLERHVAAPFATPETLTPRGGGFNPRFESNCFPRIPR